MSLCGIVRPAGCRRLHGWKRRLDLANIIPHGPNCGAPTPPSIPEPRRGRSANSELLRQAEIDRAARSVLVGKFADAGHAAQQIDLVEQVDERQPHRDRPAGRPCEDVRYAEIDLLVGRNGFAVEFEIVGRLGAQAGPGNQIDAKPRAAPQIRRPGGFGLQLAVVGVDEHAVGRGELRRGEVELRRIDALRLLIGERQIAVKA